MKIIERKKYLDELVSLSIYDFLLRKNALEL